MGQFSFAINLKMHTILEIFTYVKQSTTGYENLLVIMPSYLKYTFVVLAGHVISL